MSERAMTRTATPPHAADTPAKPQDAAGAAAGSDAGAGRSGLTDALGRRVRYLRLSVTDRCNLRCSYCWGCAAMRFIPHEEVLRYEEMMRIVDVAVEEGVEKVRLTGGEPFVRKGLTGFVAMLRQRFPALDIRITTNGTLLAAHAGALRDLGVSTVNISLDTFRRDRFAATAGRDMLHLVLGGIHAALDAGLAVKINAVALKGVNDDELPVFLDFARRHPVDVRFIEFMPMGGGTNWTEDQFWSASDILSAAERLADLTPLAPGERRKGPAKLWGIAGGLGRFGLITPLSDHFCRDCNRLRVTPDGRLRTCLFSDREYRLRPLLRHPKLGTAAVRAVLRLANRRKPLGHQLLARVRAGQLAELRAPGQEPPNAPGEGGAAVARRRMSAIGG